MKLQRKAKFSLACVHVADIVRKLSSDGKLYFSSWIQQFSPWSLSFIIVCGKIEQDEEGWDEKKKFIKW